MVILREKQELQIYMHYNYIKIYLQRKLAQDHRESSADEGAWHQAC